jgi:hypothetical protein
VEQDAVKCCLEKFASHSNIQVREEATKSQDIFHFIQEGMTFKKNIAEVLDHLDFDKSEFMQQLELLSEQPEILRLLLDAISKENTPWQLRLTCIHGLGLLGVATRDVIDSLSKILLSRRDGQTKDGGDKERFLRKRAAISLSYLNTKDGRVMDVLKKAMETEPIPFIRDGILICMMALGLHKETEYIATAIRTSPHCSDKILLLFCKKQFGFSVQ